MPSTPDDILAAAIAAVQECGSLTRRLDAARRQAKESAARAATARENVAAEARDVDKLESMSFTTIFAHLKGSHAGDLARETAEQQAAEYEYLTLQARADADQRVVDDYASQLSRLGDVQARYRRALAEKEKWLVDGDHPAAARLGEIAEERGRLTAQLNEVVQALAAGRTALEHLVAADDELGSARSWSTFDTWFDGGVLTSMAKHDRLDSGTAHMRRADSALKRFATELADTNIAGVHSLEVGKVTRTFDVWFDNIFSDLAVRSAIIDGQDNVAKTVASVKNLLNTLRAREQFCTDALARLQTERATLLES